MDKIRDQFEPDIFIPFLQNLVDQSGQSMRSISLKANLDPGAVRRFLRNGTRPSRDACVTLAHYFDLPPNDFLDAAGYPPRAYFDLSLADPNEFSPDVKEVAQELMKISEPTLRRRVSQAVLSLVREMFTPETD